MKRSSNGKNAKVRAEKKMTSEKQIKANRRNALKSTGPRTSAGKTKASKNAVHHGLLSLRSLVLMGEDPQALFELTRGLYEILEPEGELEETLVNRIVSASWKLRRLNYLETEIYHENIAQILKSLARDKRWKEEHPEYEDDGEGYEFDRIMDAKDGGRTLVGRAFIRDSEGKEALAKLSRYETAIERSLYRAIHELQRLQASRKSGVITPPVAVDVAVLGTSA